VHSCVSAYNYHYHHTYKTTNENNLNGKPGPNPKWSLTYNENNNPSPTLSQYKNAKFNIAHKTHQNLCMIVECVGISNHQK